MGLMKWSIFFFILFQSSYAVKTKSKNLILCANSVGFIAHIAEDGGPEIISTESPYQKCENNYCYTLWQEDPNNGSVIIMGQGEKMKYTF